LKSLGFDSKEARLWSKNFQAVFEGKIDTWDYQWVLSCWAQGRCAIIPEVNLISNIGFGEEATHTTGASIYADMPTEPVLFPLAHPRVVLPHNAADRYTARHMFPANIAQRIAFKFLSFFFNSDTLTEWKKHMAKNRE